MSLDVDGASTTYVPNNGQRLTNAMHRYEQVDDADLTYDLSGNLLSDGTNTYAYDIFNRQISMTGPGGTAEYVYDALGRRVAKIVNGVTTYYVYQVVEERDATNALTARYVYGAGVDEPLTMERGGTMYTYHRDALGSITEITNASGDLVERYEYDVYGEPQIFDSTETPLTASAIGNPYLFTGRRFDPESGNYYYRARIYSPTLGRFLQTDPLGYVDGLNLYAYVGNNPGTWIDPLGLYYAERMAGVLGVSFGAAGAVMGGSGAAVICLPTIAGSVVCAPVGAAGGGAAGTAAGAAIGYVLGSAVDTAIMWWPMIFPSIPNQPESTPPMPLDLWWPHETFPGNSCPIDPGIISTPGELQTQQILTASNEVTPEGIREIEEHLGQLDALNDPANKEMLRRLKSGQISETELRFYEHELIESQLIEDYEYDGARKAHLETLKKQGIEYQKGYEKQLYGEELYEKYMK